MQAVRWHARGDVRVDEVAEPELPSDDWALVEVSLCGICGTDVGEFKTGPRLIATEPHPLTRQTSPVTLGHEFVGRIVRLAGGGPEPGTRVTADATLRCGRCSDCLRGDYNLCRFGGSIGLHLDGAMAPLVALPSYTLVPVSDQVDDRQAALTEPFAVALHCLGRAGLQAAERLLVIGFGAIGASCALVARALGTAPVVVDANPDRLAAADALGLDTLAAGDDLPRRVRRTLGGGGADVVVEATGVPDVLATAVECAARGGRIVLTGLPAAPSTLAIDRVVLFERSLIGCLGYRYDLPRVLALVEQRRFDPSVLVGDIIVLERVPHALSELAGPTPLVKVLVDPNG